MRRRKILKSVGTASSLPIALSSAKVAQADDVTKSQNTLDAGDACNDDDIDINCKDPVDQWTFDAYSWPLDKVVEKLGVCVSYYGSIFQESTDYWIHDVCFAGSVGRDEEDSYLGRDTRVNHIGHELNPIDDGVGFAELTLDEFYGGLPEGDTGNFEGADMSSATLTAFSTAVGLVNKPLGLGLSAASIVNDVVRTDVHEDDGLKFEFEPEKCDWSGFLCGPPRGWEEGVHHYQRCQVLTDRTSSRPKFELEMWGGGSQVEPTEFDFVFETFQSEDDGISPFGQPEEISSKHPEDMSEDVKEFLNLREVSPMSAQNNILDESKSRALSNHIDLDEKFYMADIPMKVSEK
ncbi:hypothetical protein [Natronobeatus ordinarius]|uniref:hypothetical protein n=1 Tax=Natronobeatus ordinarius TaxID=2963433 RepID=UPI0020CF37FF|nr:hypothetical protein [Natronobeatus ordinarius]